jgi:hypothetical protein
LLDIVMRRGRIAATRRTGCACWGSRFTMTEAFARKPYERGIAFHELTPAGAPRSTGSFTRNWRPGEWFAKASAS